MNNNLIMENYLLNLKSTVEVFVHGTLESSNEEVRETLKNGLDIIMQAQADTYDVMAEYGWYTVENVKAKDICKIINKLEKGN